MGENNDKLYFGLVSCRNRIWHAIIRPCSTKDMVPVHQLTNERVASQGQSQVAYSVLVLDLRVQSVAHFSVGRSAKRFTTPTNAEQFGLADFYFGFLLLALHKTFPRALSIYRRTLHAL